MINRRSFLRLVRNRVAAGVLCSGMLTDALENGADFVLAEVYPSSVPKIHYVSTHGLGFKVSEEIMQDDMYGTITEAMKYVNPEDTIQVLLGEHVLEEELVIEEKLTITGGKVN